jgi:hypothetical protein
MVLEGLGLWRPEEAVEGRMAIEGAKRRMSEVKEVVEGRRL